MSLSDEAGTGISLTLTETEAHELMSLGLRVFEKRQAGIAKSIADMKPIALMPPSAEYAEYDEVPPPPTASRPSTDPTDDMPF